MASGRFITLEGGEGSGKSTQVRLLARACEAAGEAVVITREPGGTPEAEAIRALLVQGEAGRWDAASETLLFYAARLHHVTRLIRPALEEGKTVLCDRFADSTIVYQGIGKGLGEAYVRELHRLALGDFAPDLTLVLDIPVEQGLARAAGRLGKETRFESMQRDFHERVRQGFLALAQREPQRCVTIDASLEAHAVHEAIIAAANARLGLTLSPQEPR